MDFTEALGMLKEGKKLKRKGWNGKGMYVYVTLGKTIPLKDWNGPVPEGAVVKGDVIRILPHIDMKTADGSLNIGWLASQMDIFADDWEVIE